MGKQNHGERNHASAAENFAPVKLVLLETTKIRMDKKHLIQCLQHGTPIIADGGYNWRETLRVRLGAIRGGTTQHGREQMVNVDIM